MVGHTKPPAAHAPGVGLTGLIVLAEALNAGMVLGIDVGFSPTSRSTCFCTLEWDRSFARLRFCLTTASPSDRRAALETLVNGRRVAGVALDGPLTKGFRRISHYRSAEAILSRGALQKRGKPGQTSAPVGQKLHAHASELASLVAEKVSVDRATHCDPIAPYRIVEAFPNIYLAALVDEAALSPIARNATDVYWSALVGTQNKLALHVGQLLPGRTLDSDLGSITNHDHRAGVICALTALSVALERHVAVGDALDGDIMLPAQSDWGISARTPGTWLDPILRANLATVRTGRLAHDNHKNARIRLGMMAMAQPNTPLEQPAILPPFGRSAVRGSTTRR